MKRVGRIVKLKPGMKDHYINLHANPWPEVTKAIHDCGLRNFSIYLKEDTLFSYFEYVGKNFTKDMECLDTLTKEWLKETDRCQQPAEGAAADELWSAMDEVFYQD